MSICIQTVLSLPPGNLKFEDINKIGRLGFSEDKKVWAITYQKT